MLPQRHRLTVPIGKNARSYTTPLFVLKVRESDSPMSRFGFVVSRRTAKSAVVRNRTKRLFRAAIERSLSHILPGYDMLFIIRAVPEASETIATLIEQTLRKQHVWQNEA